MALSRATRVEKRHPCRDLIIWSLKGREWLLKALNAAGRCNDEFYCWISLKVLANQINKDDLFTQINSYFTRTRPTSRCTFAVASQIETWRENLILLQVVSFCLSISLVCFLECEKNSVFNTDTPNQRQIQVINLKWSIRDPRVTWYIKMRIPFRTSVNSFNAN